MRVRHSRDQHEQKTSQMKATSLALQGLGLGFMVGVNCSFRVQANCFRICGLKSMTWVGS